MSARNFFTELKRRHVYRVAAGYAVVAWLLIQIATQVFPFFEIPNWAVRFFVLALVAGLPIALVIAWAFDLTPEGIKWTDAEGKEPSRRSRRIERIWIVVIVLGALASLGLYFFGRSVERISLTNKPAGEKPPAKSIAVLPFDNLSRDPDNAYFAEGVQDEILTRLARLPDFKVIARSSTKNFKSNPDDLSQIAQRLGVAHFLEGSVQRITDQVRVNVQLIDAATDAHLWADSYDGKTTDIFAVESQIAQAVATTLQATLTGAEQHAIAVRPTENSEAHDLYLRGRFFWNKRTTEGFRTALDYFEQATRADPDYAAAYAGTADCYLLLPLYGGEVPTTAYPKAKAMAKKAIAIDPDLAEPHVSLGLLDALGFEFPASVHEFERAIQLNPNYATAHQWFGDSTLVSLGQFDRANAELHRALELDPLSVIINDDVGATEIITGHYAEAAAQLRKTIEMDPSLGYLHRDLGQALEFSGDLPAAIGEYKQAAQLDSDPPLGLLGAAEAKAGDRVAAVKTLERLTETARHHYVPDYAFALIHLALGDKDEAMRWLESSYAKRQPDLNVIRVDLNLRALHGDARFQALAERIVPIREFTPPVLAAHH